jgi:aldehyde:ferredoxin oxidoreductase
MPCGYTGRVLRVNLGTSATTVEEPGEEFYRTYFGGSSLIGYYLIKEVAPGVDPLGPENKLILACGVVTGVPVSGSGRNAIGAKSPLTGAFGESDVGGFWGAELKRAGYDAVIVEGQADRPVYLWVRDGEVQVRDASHLWGTTTGDCQDMIRSELGESAVQLSLIGPGGENLVRYACILNGTRHAAGRTGLGAVMGSKRLKAIAVRGTRPVQLADPQGMRAKAQWVAGVYMQTSRGLHDNGTAGLVARLALSGGLPVRNFRDGSFEGAAKISGEAMTQTILVGRTTCYSCPIRCKRVVEASEPYAIDPLYGGPQYESVAALGSNCGIDDLVAVAKANELCNAYGIDTISTGSCIAFAMECFEAGLLTKQETGGLELTFGNASAMLEMVELIARRRGLGELLSEGVMRAAEQIGSGAERFAMHVKGQELPMHEPRLKQGLGLGYAVSPTGAEHVLNIQDTLYAQDGGPFARPKALGILKPLAPSDLGPDKVRLFMYLTYWESLFNCLAMCQMQPYDVEQVVEIVNSATGWNTTVWELMKVGERALNLGRVFNSREGFTVTDDCLPVRFFASFPSGPLAGVAVDQDQLRAALRTYYGMMGWDKETGLPTVEKLQELGIAWAANELPEYSVPKQ